MHKPMQAKDAGLEPDVVPGTTAVPASADLMAGIRAALESLRDTTSDAAARDRLDQAMRDLGCLEQSGESSRARYRMLLNAVPDAVTVHDESGRIIAANAAACRTYGYTIEQLEQRSVRDLNPDLPPDHMLHVWHTFELGKTVTVETSNRRADGSVFPTEVHSNAFLDEGRRRVVAVARDISERKSAEQELRAAEFRYRTLLRTIDKGVIVRAADGTLISANPAAYRLLGASESDPESLQPAATRSWQFIDENNEPVAHEDVPTSRAFQTGKKVDSTILGIYLPQAHRYRWLSVTAVPQFPPGSDQPDQVISMFSDVSALKREAEMFRTTQGLAEIGCWEIDDLRGTIFWTEQMFRIHDLPPGSPISESRALNFFTDEHRDALHRALAATRKHARSFELELQIASSIGRKRWLCIRGQPMMRHGRIFGVVGTLQNIDERKALEARLRQQAAIDPLTGLANRNTILARITDAIGRARPGTGPAVLYIDLDRFKVLNDILGHSAGDQLMVAASQRLADCAAGNGELSRFGNDEFVLLVADTHGHKQIEVLANRIVEAFAEVFECPHGRFALSTSIGIAEYPQDGSDAQELVRHADVAMSEAKRRGRSTWQEYSDALPQDQPDRLHVEAHLRLALDNDELHLEYQPQIDLRHGTVVAVEALLRWNSRQLGPLAPAAFIPQAESSGDIVRIGAWVMRESCRQLRQWRDAGLALDRIAVNVSYRQLLSGTLYSSVQEALHENDLPGHMLELEMTERVMIENVADTVEIFRKLKSLGVSLLIDDFGEGYSSLNYLRHLPLDGIKISHTFMQGIPTEATDTVLCEAMVRIATSLGLRVVAEGVETDAQRQFLLALGTPLAQGFLFSHPLPPEKVTAFVQKQFRHRGTSTEDRNAPET